jgi:hypothetical protein
MNLIQMIRRRAKAAGGLRPAYGAVAVMAALLTSACANSGVRAASAASGEAATASPVWLSCDPAERVAYWVVPAALNHHNTWTQPIKVSLKPSQTCADFK